MKQPYLEFIVPFAIGLFFVLYINASYFASTTYPKHYVDIATAYVANKKESEGRNPTEASGA